MYARIMVVIGVAMVVATGQAAQARVYYVSKSGNNASSGLSWANAKASIYGALQAASHGDEIWVAEGTYTSSTVELTKRVAIYGGFQGNETARDQRDWRRRETVLKNAAFNFFRIAPGTTIETLLDGLVLSGHVNTYPEQKGVIYLGGYASERTGLTIRNCLFRENTCAIRVGSLTDLVVENCRFIDCSQALLYSGSNSNSVVTVRNSLFAFCSGVRLFDAKFFVWNVGSLSLVNNTMVGNMMTGSLIELGDSNNLLIANNILAFNDADHGIYQHPVDTGPRVLRNNCLYQTSRSTPYGGALADQTGTNGNIAVDPKLVYRADTYEGSNLRLTAASPCRNTGSNTGVDWPLDLDGRNRILDTTVDMGAYERGSGPIYVKPGGNDRNSGATWALAKATPQAALDSAADNEIWVAAGTYANTNVQFPVGPSLYGGFTGTETARGQRNSGANETILDGGGEGTVVVFRQGVGETSVLDGFSIRNGNPSGIRLREGSNTAITSPTIRNNRILDNQANLGGGIYIADKCAPLVENNIISNNIAQTGTQPARGAGIYVDARFLPEGKVVNLRNNEIRGNTCSSGSEGGGVWMQGTRIVVADNLIEKNNADLGGGIWMSGGTVRNNRIVGNIALAHGGAVFGGSILPAPPPTGFLINNLISGNTTPGHGGGLAIWSSGWSSGDGGSSILGNTIVYNTAGQDGGAIAQRTANGIAEPPGGAAISLQYCIVAHNSSGVQANLSQVTGHVQHNCFYGNGEYNILGNYDPINAPHPALGSAGNFSAAPGFVWQGEWRVRSDSPCVNVGDAPSGTDLDGQPRTLGGARDIGADEVLVVYVRPGGSDTNTGLSWAQAKQTVQAGIAAALPGGEVWVATGVYTEAIALANGVQLYGGFIGTETSLAQRNFLNNKTVLEGAGGSVVSAGAGVGASARLDGFTIQNGNAQYGGGIACVGASPVIAHCIIMDNSATYGGGISLRDGSHASFVSTVFYRNTVGNFGSALYCEGSDPSLLNCTVAGHLSVGNGALHFVNASPLIANSIVANNAAGLTHVSGGVPTLRYNCVYGNSAFEYNGISSPTGTFGNISQNPVLTDGWRIDSASPCRDAGQNTFVPDSMLDIDGQPRIWGDCVDMGADESVIVYVKPDGNNAHEGVSWATAKATVQAALNAAAPSGDIWVKQGTYSGNIVIPEGVALYGGFAGNEARFALRKWRVNETVLQGSGTDSVVQFAAGATARTRIDGFTIRNGGAVFGAGIRCENASPVIANNIIRDNVSPSGGGGIGCLDGGSAQILNNFIHENEAANEGGGIAVQSGTPLIACNIIARNTAVAGGAIQLVESSTVKCVNNTIVYNTSTGPGPEVVVIWNCATPVFANNLVALNSAGVRKDGTGTTAFTANCAYNTPGVNYTGQADPTGSGGNISADPKFVNVAADDYHLQSDSPCRNAGDNAQVQAGWVDMDGQPRIIGAFPDIGADELPSFLHVSATGNDANTGLTWGAAKQTIQAAMNAAVSGDQIWVQAGTYIERITIKSGVAVYGGFSGTENHVDARDIAGNLTVINGANAGTTVTISINATAATRLDGFRIVGGNASNGGGIWCREGAAPTIANNTISSCTATNNGGGIFVDGSANPVIINNILQYNSAGTGAGIMYSLSSGGIFANNVVAYNNAGVSGGGIGLFLAQPHIINNSLLNNTADTSGSAVVTAASPSALLANNLVAFNTGSAAIVFDANPPAIRHTCVYNPEVDNYAGIADPTGSNGNIAADPLRASATDWHLSSTSPCKDAGNDSDVLPAWLDIDGQARIADDAVDIGADEIHIVRVAPGGDNARSGDSWSAAKATIQAAIDAVYPHGEVWAAAGAYVENIVISKGVALYGGFSGAEKNAIDRDWTANVAVIDGDLRNAGVRFEGATAAARLDGFTVRNGLAEFGGGIHVFGSSPVIANCTVTDNIALNGGGIAMDIANPRVYNTVVANNLALQGGGMHIRTTSGTVISNTTIVNNIATDEAGGIYCSNNANPTIRNTIIAGHELGGILADSTSAPQLFSNCLNNKSYNYDGVTPGTGDITAMPAFVSAAYGDYRPAAQSSVIDAGNDAMVPQGVTTDAGGRPRIADGNGDGNAQTDIGAFERVLGGDIGCILLPDTLLAFDPQWRLTTGSETDWRANRHTLGELPAGTYTLVFSDVPEWSTPDSRTVTIADNQAQMITATYSPFYGNLTVTLLPSEILPLGGWWRIVGTMEWHESGYTIADVPAGEHFIEFSEVAGWFTPVLQQVTVTPGGNVAATGEYNQHSGRLTVRLFPEEAAWAGAQWTVSGGGSWQNDGDSLVLPVGTYSLMFKDLDGWITPAGLTVNMMISGDLNETGFYQEILPVEGEGEALPEGEGETPVEGEGETPVEGEGETLPEGEALPEGEGEAPVEGETFPEGEGETLPEGEAPVEGEGEAPVEGETFPEGEGETLPEGEAPVEGEGEAPVEGETFPEG
ncbi:MAG: DUF1565 domain-containing protein, partial [Candidatus Hydrogenedentes bacterium]|nr:DUF1565 domain-containing protein [Candidatus Hydrogenedentota bacterium]